MNRSLERGEVLVVDDEPNVRRVISLQLQRQGYGVHEAGDGEEALSILREHHVDAVVSDLRMPRLDGMGLLQRIVSEDSHMPVIMLTAHGTVDTAVDALKRGAFDFITKPFDRDQLRSTVAKALRTRELRDRDTGLGNRGRFALVGQSPAMHGVYRIIERAADTTSTVLVTGQSGTGKELVAQALHQQGSRREKPLIRVNCAAIPSNLLESELFGHEKGAFTGATSAKPGRFELAHGGTLFLDEIAEIPVDMQVKLLRAIQEQEFERVGGVHTAKVDVRLVAATNRDLEEEIGRGTFREDLYYRLNVIRIELPTLSQRREDIPLLVEHFIERLNHRMNKEVHNVSSALMERLTGHDWPGNIRELENVLERMMLFADGDTLDETVLPPNLVKPGVSSTLPPLQDMEEAYDSGGLKAAVKEATAVIEKDYIERALQETGGNVTHAARLLRISRKSLQLKMRDLNLRELPE